MRESINSAIELFEKLEAKETLTQRERKACKQAVEDLRLVLRKREQRVLFAAIAGIVREFVDFCSDE